MSIEVSNIHGKCLYLLANYVDMTPLLELTKEQTWNRSSLWLNNNRTADLDQHSVVRKPALCSTTQQQLKFKEMLNG